MKNTIILPILILLVFFQTIISFKVIEKVNVIRFADEATYLKRGLQLYYLIFENKNNVNVIGEIFKIQRDAIDRPPFLFLVQAIVWKFLKISKINNENILVLLVNMFFLIIIVLSCYGIGSFLCNKIIGLVCAILLSFTPIIFAYSRVITTDLPISAMVCCSMYFLFKTNNFQSRFYSICLGIVIALSQLTRETFFLYFTVPLLWYVYKSLQQNYTKKVFYNVLISMFLCFIILGPVFFNPNSFYAYKKYFKLSQLVVDKTYWYYYFVNFRSILGNLMFIMTIPIFVYSIIKNKKINKILFIWFWMPIIIFSIMQNRALRFIMPIVPAYFLIISQSLFIYNFKQIFKNILLIIMTIISLLQYLIINFGFYHPNVLFLSGKGYEFVMFVGTKDKGKCKYFSLNEKIIDIFKNENLNGGEEKMLITFFGISEIVTPLEYKFIMENIPVKLDTSILADSVDAPVGVNWEKKLLEMNYFIDKVGGFLGKTGAIENIREKLISAYLKYKDQFELIGKIRVEEDNSYILVYKNKNPLQRI